MAKLISDHSWYFDIMQSYLFALNSRAVLTSIILMFMFPLRAFAGEPIRLLVIPYQSGWGSQKIPVNTFTGPAAPPPPPLLPQADRVVPRVIEGGDVDNDVDDAWLMDG